MDYLHKKAFTFPLSLFAAKQANIDKSQPILLIQMGPVPKINELDTPYVSAYAYGYTCF